MKWFVEVDDEGVEVSRDWEGRKEMGGWRIDSMGWAISWVVFARDVSGVDCDVLQFDKVVYKLEDLICGTVSAAATPPTFNDAGIVSEEFEMRMRGAVCK